MQYCVPEYCLAYPTNLFQDKEKLPRKPRHAAPSKDVVPIKLRMAGVRPRTGSRRRSGAPVTLLAGRLRTWCWSWR